MQHFPHQILFITWPQAMTSKYVRSHPRFLRFPQRLDPLWQKKKLRRFALDKRHLVCDFCNKKRPIDFHLSMKHAWMHAWWFCESEWVWIPHIVKNDEVLNYTERHNELSDPPICHLSLSCAHSLSLECMPELGIHHPSCISPQWQFPLLFSRAFLLSVEQSCRR